jgi:hypothetical protein
MTPEVKLAASKLLEALGRAEQDGLEPITKRREELHAMGVKALVIDCARNDTFLTIVGGNKLPGGLDRIVRAEDVVKR